MGVLTQAFPLDGEGLGGDECGSIWSETALDGRRERSEPVRKAWIRGTRPRKTPSIVSCVLCHLGGSSRQGRGGSRPASV